MTTTASSCCLRKSVFCFCENLSGSHLNGVLGHGWLLLRHGSAWGCWMGFGQCSDYGSMGRDASTIEHPWRLSLNYPRRSRSRSCRNLTTENTRNCHFFRPHTYYHCCGTFSHSARPNELRRSYDENGVLCSCFCRAILCIEGRNRKIRGGSDIVLT